MLFTSMLFSAFALTSSASAEPAPKAKNIARQDTTLPGDEVKFVLSLSTRLGSISTTLNEANFPETSESPELEDLFDTISFAQGPDVDPELRCRIFANAAAGIEDTILLTRGANEFKNSFSQGNPWVFSNGPSQVASIQCAVLEDDFFASP